MFHLIIRFAKHQIIFDILSTSFGSLIAIKQVWPQPRAPRQLEDKFKIYTQSHYGFCWSEFNDFEFWYQNYWPMKSCSCPKTFSSLIPGFFKHSISFFPSFNIVLCPKVFEAVAEAILTWSRWNFQNLWVRYKSWFDI